MTNLSLSSLQELGFGFIFPFKSASQTELAKLFPMDNITLK